MIALVFAGILFILVAPKLQFGDVDTQLIRNRTDMVVVSVANAIDLYRQSTGATLNFASVPLETIYVDYGLYMAQKGNWPSGLRYFLQTNGARLTMVPEVFHMHTGPNGYREYMRRGSTNCWVLGLQQWGPSAGGDGFCGDFSANECFYVDSNGRTGPNEISLYNVTPERWGEIIPFRVDPATGNIQTLYQWEMSLGVTAPTLCRYMTAYDQALGATCAGGSQSTCNP